MKKIILSASLLASALFYSQTGGYVGINTTDPKATLDVNGKSNDTSKFDGIIAPRITGDELRAKTYGTDQTGALIYATAADSAPAGQTINITVVGYYYFDGSLWVKMGATGATNALQYYDESSTAPSPFSNNLFGDNTVVIGSSNDVGKVSPLFGTNQSTIVGYQNHSYNPNKIVENAFVFGAFNGARTSHSYLFGEQNMSHDIYNADNVLGIGFNNNLRASDTGAIGKGINNSTSSTLQLGWGSSAMTITKDENIGIGTTSPNSTLQVAGSVAAPIKVVAPDTDVILGDKDYQLIYTGTFTANGTLTLPAASTCPGRIYKITMHGDVITDMYNNNIKVTVSPAVLGSYYNS